MKLNVSEILIYLFYVLCVMGTMGFCIDCILKYLRDEDAPQTEYQKFHHNSEDDLYPSISFCIINPFVETKLKEYGENINISSYSFFLQGLHWDDRMQDISYDNVTVSVEDSLLGITIEHHDQTFKVYDHKKDRKKEQPWINSSNPLLFPRVLPRSVEEYGPVEILC